MNYGEYDIQTKQHANGMWLFRIMLDDHISYEYKYESRYYSPGYKSARKARAAAKKLIKRWEAKDKLKRDWHG